MKYAAILVLALAAGFSARADIVTLNPVADTFISSAQPTGNFGGAGALAVAASGLPQGEFQSLVRFDTAAAINSFNTSMGVGNWVITDISLTLTTTAPNNAIFNASAAGQFTLTWMQNDTWVEGTGSPAGPNNTGVSYETLPLFLSPADDFLGVFNFPGGTSGTVVCQPIPTASLAADVGLGHLVSFRMTPEGNSVAWVFNSRSFGTVANRPSLKITAVPAPASAMLLLAAMGPVVVRRRRA